MIQICILIENKCLFGSNLFKLSQLNRLKSPELKTKCCERAQPATHQCSKVTNVALIKHNVVDQ